jgi:predicted small lipoprotein YifL
MPTYRASCSDREPAVRPRLRRRTSSWLFAAVLLSAAAGCGKQGPPMPPEPRGPFPPLAVDARQVGRVTRIGFQLPTTRGPKPSQQLIRAELIRVTFPPGQEPSPDPDVFRRRGEDAGTLEGDPLTSDARLWMEDSDFAGLVDDGVGSSLRYGVRVRDRRGRSSPLVLANDVVLISSRPAPRLVSAEPTADGVRLTWEPPDVPGDLTYNLYRLDRPEAQPETPINAEPLTVTEYLDENAAVGQQYAYVVRVVLEPGRPYREGESSAALEVLTKDRFAPAPPRGLVTVQEGLAVRLFWDPNRERDLAGYRVYRKIEDGEWERIGPDVVGNALHLDDKVDVGQRLAYRVTAIDRADPPNESEPSEEKALVVLAEPAAPGI